MRKSLILFTLVFLGLSTSFAEPLCDPSSSKKALVVIDMQNYFLETARKREDPANKAKAAQAIKEQVFAIAQARKARWPIILVEWDHPGYTQFQSQTASEIVTALSGYENLKVIKKTSDGIFESYNQHLEATIAYFKQEQLGTLVVTGANGGSCVHASIEGLLDAECNVVAYNKAIIDFNYNENIYPYVGQYGQVKSTCQHCTFGEISDLNNLESFNGSRPQVRVPYLMQRTGERR